MVYLIPVLIALALLTAAFGLQMIRGGHRHIDVRLKEVRTGAHDGHVLAEDVWDRRLPWYMRVFGVFSVLLPGQAQSDTTRWELAQAGYRALDAPAVFVGMRVLSTAGIGVASFLVTSALRRPQAELIMLTVVGIALGYMGPVMFLRWKQAQRRDEITRSLPDALDLMVICVEAGLGLNAAILNVGREIRLNSVELSEELRMVNSEMRAGMARLEALRNLAVRTGVDEVRALVAVLVQSDRFGTSIAQALRTHAASLRTRRRQRAEEAARKTPVKMVFPLVFCIFPELLVVILAPGMLQLFRALMDMARG
jgi:tight adherence protein C